MISHFIKNSISRNIGKYYFAQAPTATDYY